MSTGKKRVIDKGGAGAYNIDMKEVKSYLRGLLIAAIIITVLFVAGIPMIPVGATTGIYAVMGVGIALTAAGFYATPIIWTIYGSNVGLKRIVHAVTEEHLYSVREIAAQLSLNEKNVRDQLTKCFNKNFLPGYKRDGDNIVLNENIAAGKKESFYECPYCGAKFTYTKDNARCPYCGSPVQQ